MDRRKCQRFEVQLPASFSGNDEAGGGLVTNLSKDGCGVVSEEPVLSATFLALRIQLPGRHFPLRVEAAEVRWTSGAGFGLEFRHLRAEEQERFHRFIAALEAGRNN